MIYCKNKQKSETQKISCNHPKIWTRWLYCTVMCPKDPKNAEGIANSVDPYQEQSDLGLHC